jgi:hypothetical protein
MPGCLGCVEKETTVSEYYIVRKYFNSGPWAALANGGELIKHGLTLEEAQEHCSDPETSSRTCTSEEGVQRTEERGPWFDCYYEGTPIIHDKERYSLPFRVPKWAQPWRHD